MLLLEQFKNVLFKAAMRAGAKGIKTAVSGRLGGADMASAEGYSEGECPSSYFKS